MVSSVQKTIINSMLSFKTSFRITTDDPVEAVEAAINSNPKIAYFLHNYRIHSVMDQYEIRALYINKNTPLSDIYIVDSEAACIHHMRQSVGNYKKKLIVVVKNTVDLNLVYDEFHTKHITFYPNLIGIKTMGYHSYGYYTVIEYTFEYRIGQVMLNMMENEVDAEVARISKLLFTTGMPVEAKIYLAHNYLAMNVRYKKNRNNDLDCSYTQSAYGALIKHECVCQGYAEAFKRIMDYNKIECDVVSGQIVGSTGYHAWNIVSLGKDDSFYHIDVTWDSDGLSPGYMYFCKSDTHFNGKRVWDRKFNHACSGRYAVLSIAKKYVYENKRMLLAKGIDKTILDC